MLHVVSGKNLEIMKNRIVASRNQRQHAASQSFRSKFFFSKQLKRKTGVKVGGGATSKFLIAAEVQPSQRSSPTPPSKKKNQNGRRKKKLLFF
jgi:hypothetical protein